MKYRTLRASDIGLIAGLLVFAGAFWFVAGGFGSAAGEMVTVRRGGVIYASVPVSEDGSVSVALPDGTVTNTVRISGGEVFMEYANCPDGLCLKHGALRGGRDVIVCLPNSVIVEISGGGAVDAVSK